MPAATPQNHTRRSTPPPSSKKASPLPPSKESSILRQSQRNGPRLSKTKPPKQHQEALQRSHRSNLSSTPKTSSSRPETHPALKHGPSTLQLTRGSSPVTPTNPFTAASGSGHASCATSHTSPPKATYWAIQSHCPSWYIPLPPGVPISIHLTHPIPRSPPPPWPA